MTEEQKRNAQEVEAEVISEEEETKVETNLDKVVNKVTSFIKKHKTTIVVSGLTGITGYVVGRINLFGDDEDELFTDDEVIESTETMVLDDEHDDEVMEEIENDGE